MIIFPFGFYILEGKSPLYVGNDLHAQKTVQAWMETNPDKVRLRFDLIGSAEVSTRFLGWNEELRSGSMDPTPLLFESTICREGRITVRRAYSDYDAALAGHCELVESARSGLH